MVLATGLQEVGRLVVLVGPANEEEEGNAFLVFGLVTLAAASAAVLFFVGEGI